MLRTIKLYEDLSYFESSDDLAKEVSQLQAYLQQSKQELDGKIAQLIGSLQRQILNDKLPAKTGFFNGIHKWWKNLFGGSNKRSNPYYWQNKIGALGRTDIDPNTVEEYRMINQLAVSLAEAVGTNPQSPLITKILNNWSSQVRSVVNAHFNDMIDRVGKMKDRIGNKESPAPILDKTVLADPKEKSKRSVRPMPDKVDEPAPMPASKSTSDSEVEDLDAEAAKLGIDLNDPMFVKLDTYEKKLQLINSLKAAKTPRPPFVPYEMSPEMTARTAAIEKEAARKAEEEATAPHNPLKDKSHNEIQSIIDKHKNKSAHNVKVKSDPIDEEEKAVFDAVHAPWTELEDSEKDKYNELGGSRLKPAGTSRKKKAKAGHSRRMSNGAFLPFNTPPVLRKVDPRYHILHKYYRDLFDQLGKNGEVEKDSDSEQDISDRITKYWNKIENTRKTRGSGKRNTKESGKSGTDGYEDDGESEKRDSSRRDTKELGESGRDGYEDEDDIIRKFDKFTAESTTKSGKALLEALKMRLRQQREGKLEAWQSKPKTVSGLVEQMRKQSQKTFQES